jgi:thiamine pyrophosphate-dependent acetolactate synthase large subunit-like protein
VVAIGGSSPILQFGRQVFQEIDQVGIMARAASSGPIACTISSAFQNR